MGVAAMYRSYNVVNVVNDFYTVSCSVWLCVVGGKCQGDVYMCVWGGWWIH